MPTFAGGPTAWGSGPIPGGTSSCTSTTTGTGTRSGTPSDSASTSTDSLPEEAGPILGQERGADRVVHGGRERRVGRAAGQDGVDHLRYDGRLHREQERSPGGEEA